MPLFGELIDRYRREERIEEILRQRPGCEKVGELAYSTAMSYSSYLENYLRTRWGKTPIDEIRPMQVQAWLQSLDRSPKTRGPIKALMHRLFEKAALWEYAVHRNPIQLVEVRGISKRTRKIEVLTVEQYRSILAQLPQPYRTMVMLAQYTGLRVSEILPLRWMDIDFKKRILRVSRGVVHGRVGPVKTASSEDELPLDGRLVRALGEWKQQCRETHAGWVFPSKINRAAEKIYHASPIQQDYLRPAGRAVGIERLGWHTFRHTYRTWLDATGAPVGVQQKLMRHSNVATTMNVYGQAQMKSKRRANAKVVRMLCLGAKK